MAFNAIEAAWEEMFSCAEEYFREQGDLSVPQSFQSTSGKNLGIWIAYQRKAYKNGKLSVERQKRLETIGMAWSTSEATWEKMFDLAQEYLKEHGDLNVPAEYKTPFGENLGTWIAYQRKAYKNGNLSVDRQKQLEAINMIWEPNKEAWEKMFACAQEYFREHGNLNIPVTFQTTSNERLGAWICTQRDNYRKGVLSEEREEQLGSIGMVWNTSDAAWEKMFGCAQEYSREHGNLNVPRFFKTHSGQDLEKWIRSQRENYKKNTFSVDRKKRLDAIGMIWEPYEEAWEKMFTLAQEYLKEHGNLNVPSNFRAASGESLGRWIIHQRAAYKKGTLSAERQERLESIGMVWK